MGPSIDSNELKNNKLAVHMVKEVPLGGFSDGSLNDTTDGIKRKDNC